MNCVSPILLDLPITRVDVSIIVVSWNTINLLRNCLSSIYQTTPGVTYEIIVVDNGSTDGSPDMVAGEFPTARLLRLEVNIGFARANNFGISVSKGKYICLVNSDVEMLPACIDVLYAYIESHPKVGVLGPKILNPDLTLQPSCLGIPTPWNTLCHALALDSIFPRSSFFGGLFMRFWAHDKVARVGALVGCILMVRKSHLDVVGLLDERFFMYSEDVDWCKRFQEAGYEVIFMPEAKAIHHGAGSSSSNPVRFNNEKQRAFLVYWLKHYGRAGQLYMAFVILLRELFRIVYAVGGYAACPHNRNHFATILRKSWWSLRWLFEFGWFSRSTYIGHR